MNRDVIISCAVTGSGDTVNKHPNIPVTPEQIANAAIEAASAGAAIAHIHVRDLNTGKGSRDDELYKEVVSRIKDSGTNVIINLTSGMGGDIEIGPEDDLLKFGPNTDFVNACYANNLLTVPAGDNVVRLLPPLTVSDTEIDVALEKLESAMTIFSK